MIFPLERSKSLTVVCILNNVNLDLSYVGEVPGIDFYYHPCPNLEYDKYSDFLRNIMLTVWRSPPLKIKFES